MSTNPSPADTSPFPADGPGSLARLVPRAIALLIDWFLCSLIAIPLLHYRLSGGGGLEGFKPMAVFAVENIVLVSTLGTTIGQRVMGIAVVRLNGAAPGFVSGTIRTVLLILAIPALINGADGRGLHDRFAGTAIVRTR